MRVVGGCGCGGCGGCVMAVLCGCVMAVLCGCVCVYMCVPGGLCSAIRFMIETIASKTPREKVILWAAHRASKPT